MSGRGSDRSPSNASTTPTSAAVTDGASSNSSSSSNASTGRSASRGEHKSACKSPAPPLKRTGSNASSTGSTGSKPRSLSPKKRRSAGSWYIAPASTGPGPLPGRKRKVDEFFAEKKLALRSAEPPPRSRAKPERLAMEDWTAPAKKAKLSSGDEDECMIISHTVRSSSSTSASSSEKKAPVKSASVSKPAVKAAPAPKRPAAAASKSAPSSPVASKKKRFERAKSVERKSRPSSPTRSASLSPTPDALVYVPKKTRRVLSTRPLTVERRMRRHKAAARRKAALAALQSQGSSATPVIIEEDSADDSDFDSDAFSGQSDDDDMSCSESDGENAPTAPSSAVKAKPAKQAVAAAAAKSPFKSPTKAAGSAARKAPHTDGQVGVKGSMSKAALSAARGVGGAIGPNQLHLASPLAQRRLVLTPSVLLQRSTSLGALLPPPRQTRQQAAASMAVQEEMEAQICFEMHKRAAGSHTPTKFLHRIAHNHTPSPSPSPLSGDLAAPLSDLALPAAASASVSAAQQNGAVWTVASSDETRVRLAASPVPLPTAAAAAAAVASLCPASNLCESARRRLALSSVSQPGYLSFDWIHKRAQKYLGLLGADEQAQLEATRRANPNPQYVSQLERMGTLHNGKVFVAVSTHADHNPFYVDEKRKADPQLQQQANSRWVEIPGDTSDEEDHEHAEAESGSSAGASAASGSSGDAVTSATGAAVATRSKRPRIPMLGLFAAQALPSGTWVTEYGGVLEWAGEAKRRARESNSHIRRIAACDWVWNGRPWSLLFPRVPSTLDWEADRPLDKRTRLAPLVNPRTLLNLLLLLHHEQETHALRPQATAQAAASAATLALLANGMGAGADSGASSCAAAAGLYIDRSKNVQQPFTAADCRRRVCTGTCVVCQNELRVIRSRVHCSAPAPAAASPGASSSPSAPHSPPDSPPALTPEDVLATLLPQCCCCSVSLGLLPCEVLELMNSWDTRARLEVSALCRRVEDEFVRRAGLGYMANTDVKAKQNVKVLSVSPFNKEIGSMKPRVHIYIATRDIAAGEEILVAYNNNEAKKMW